MIENGVAVCGVQCSRVPNTLPHVFARCCWAEAIWCSVAEWISVRLGRRVVLTARFILLGVGECEMENALAKIGVVEGLASMDNAPNLVRVVGICLRTEEVSAGSDCRTNGLAEGDASWPGTLATTACRSS